MPPHSTTSLSSSSPTTTTPPPRIRIPLPHPTTDPTTTDPTDTNLPTTTATHQSLPLPTALRSSINAHLLTTPAITTIQSLLLHHLQLAGWTDNVRLLVLDLLRSGECATFGECMGVVVREARGEIGGMGEGGGQEGGVGRGGGLEGEGEGGEGEGEGEEGGKDGKGIRRRRVNVDVRIPDRVVDEGVQVVREALEEIVEVVDG